MELWQWGLIVAVIALVAVAAAIGFFAGRRARVDKSGQPAWTRDILAFSVVFLCGAGVVAISIVAIANTRTDTSLQETSRLVFVSVLPLLGTWVGTVLAYYFAGKNLEAATRSTESLSEVTSRLAGVTAPETPVREEMIPSDRIKSYTLTQAEEADIRVLELQGLWTALEGISPLSRLPILTGNKAVRGVVHRSLLEGFAARASSAVPHAFDQKTVADLSADEQRLLMLFAVIPLSATVADARVAMKAVGADCNDVFVTATGKASEPVEGWLTNTKLAGLPA